MEVKEASPAYQPCNFIWTPRKGLISHQRRLIFVLFILKLAVVVDAAITVNYPFLLT
jgi:hypothetical protein